MSTRYRTRVCVRRFLNRPGHNAGAYVLAEIQDTSGKEIEVHRNELCNPEPHLVLEIADCSRRINLEFDVASSAGVRNSLHKVDTLTAALERFRAGLLEEAALYRKRERERVRQERERQSE